MTYVVRLFWTVSMLAALVGGVIGVGGVVFANGAPQEAASAAIGCLVAIAPYVVARSVDELTRGRT